MTINQFKKAIDSIIGEIKKKNLTVGMANVLVPRIKKRTRSGRGVRENLANTHRLPKLKPATVNIRRWLKSQGLLTGPGATPNKSGVNRTGKTLDSLEVKKKGPLEAEIKLDNEGERVAKELLKINEDYQFMRVSKSEVSDAVKSVIVPEIEKTIKKLFP